MKDNIGITLMYLGIVVILLLISIKLTIITDILEQEPKVIEYHYYQRDGVDVGGNKR